MKACRKCGETKPLNEFHRAAAMRDGHRNECKACWKIICKKRYAKNRDEHIAKVQEWRRRNPEKYDSYRKRYIAENRERIAIEERKGHLRRKYGLTLEEYDFLRLAQGDRCLICGAGEEGGLHVDHDHKTGRVRGLLCGKCNKAIGLLREDPALFDAASAYLQRPQLTLGCGDKTRGPTRVRRRTEPPTAVEDE